LLDNPELAFMQGMSNDVSAMIGINALGGEEVEEDSNESLMNSHRRSRS
jgi:hypothetical protein